MTDTNKNTTANSNISINNNIISNRYRMPPEWHPHYACCILYPHRSTTFPSVHKAQNEIRNLCRMIRDVGKEDVLLFCNDDSTNENETGDDDYSKIVEDLKLLFASEERKNYDDEGDDKEEEEEGNNNNNNKKKIFINVCPCDDSWCRDTGPTFVFLEEYNKNYISDGDDVDNKWTTKGFIGLDWDFNAYGGLYGPCNLDRNIAGSIVRVLDDRYPLIKQKVQHKSIPIILEGGSFHTDGEGTVLTTEECLLNPNRNPNFTKKDIEQYLQTYLGASIIIWLPFGLAYDVDTNGHVDNMATFVKPGEIVMAWTDDYKKDEQNYIRVRDNLKVLDKVVDAKGRKIRIHKLHIPDPMVRNIVLFLLYHCLLLFIKCYFGIQRLPISIYFYYCQAVISVFTHLFLSFTHDYSSHYHYPFTDPSIYNEKVLHGG